MSKLTPFKLSECHEIKVKMHRFLGQLEIYIAIRILMKFCFLGTSGKWRLNQFNDLIFMYDTQKAEGNTQNYS